MAPSTIAAAVDPRVTAAREATARLNTQRAAVREGTRSMIADARVGTSSSAAVAGRPNPFSTPYADVDRNRNRQMQGMSERREAATAAVASPSAVPYGARNVYSPLGDRAEAFRRMTVPRIELPPVGPTITPQQRYDRSQQAESQYQVSRATEPNLVGGSLAEQRNLEQNYGMYRRGWQASPQGPVMSFQEFADAYSSGDPMAAAQINGAITDAAVRRQGVTERKATGLRSRQDAAAFAARGQLPEGADGSRFMAGYAARTNPFSAAPLANSMMGNESAERISTGRDGAARDVASTNASAMMFGSEAQAQAAMYGSDAQAAMSMAETQARSASNADSLRFQREQYGDGAGLRDLQVRSAQQAFDQEQVSRAAASNPQIAASRETVEVFDRMMATGSMGADEARQIAESRGRIKFDEVARASSQPSQEGFVPPNIFAPPKDAVEGSSRGLMTGADASKLYAEISQANPSAPVTMEAFMRAANSRGFTVNERTFSDLARNAQAQGFADYNLHGFVDWTRGWGRNEGTPDPMAGQAYEDLIGEPAGSPYDPGMLFRRQPHQDPARKLPWSR